MIVRLRAIALVAVLALVAGACSVKTPRNESAFVAAAHQSANPEAAAAAAFDAATSTTLDSTTTTGLTSTASDNGAIAVSASAPNATQPAVATGPLAPGVTKDTITVSIIAGFTGVLAAMVNRAYDGLLTWQDDVNAAGGINGRKIQFKKVDHKDTADGGVGACMEAKSNGTYFAMVPEGVDATVTAVSCLDAAGIPTFYYSATTDPKWKVAFADIITSQQAGVAMASYVARPLGGAKKKVGVIYVNQASYKALADGLVPTAKQIGLDVAGVEAVEANAASFTSPLLRLRQAGVEILVISATTDAIGILRDAKSMGWAPTFVGWGFQFDFVTGAGRGLFDGVRALRSYAAVDTPAYEKYAARMNARGRGRNRANDLEGFSAYGHALVLGEVLKRAGTHPTRASLIAGAETFRGFDNGVVGPLSWAPTDHVGTHATFPVVCCNDDYTWKSAGPPQTAY